MNITTTKKLGTAAAAIVLAGALFGSSATAANAAYPSTTPVPAKITKPKATVKVGKAYTIKGATTTGAKVTVTYGKTKAKATKKADKATAKKGKFTTSFKIKTTGTYWVKVVIKKSGAANKTLFYKVKVKK
jgi:hypothetical protein